MSFYVSTELNWKAILLHQFERTWKSVTLTLRALIGSFDQKASLIKGSIKVHHVKLSPYVFESFDRSSELHTACNVIYFPIAPLLCALDIQLSPFPRELHPLWYAAQGFLRDGLLEPLNKDLGFLK